MLKEYIKDRKQADLSDSFEEKVCQEGKSDTKASPKIYAHPQLCNRLYSHSAPLQSRLLSELNVFPGQHSGYWTEALLLTSTDMFSKGTEAQATHKHHYMPFSPL